MRARFSRWDDSQDPMGGGVDVAGILEEMQDDLLSGMGGDWALGRLQRNGIPGRVRGLEHLRERLRAARRDVTEHLDLSGPIEHVRRQIDDILATERGAIGADPPEDAALRRAFLDQIPRNPAGALRELSTYEFHSPEAHRAFDALVEHVRRDVLDSFFKNIAGGMTSLTPDDLTRIKDMLAGLNEMLEARAQGDEYDFNRFMESYGDMFPEKPRNLDELLEVMARRMAAMSRLLASLTPEQRRELADLAASVLDDLDLAFQVDRLNRSLRDLMPGLPWDEGARGWGEEALPAAATIDALERLGQLEELEQTIDGSYDGATLEDVDEDALRRHLDHDAVRDLRRLKEIERALERAGALRRRRGTLELTARGARLLGERSLTRVLEQIRREPSHRARGSSAEPTGATRPWQFGDADAISVERTVLNAVTRTGAGARIRLTAEDFEVVETDSRPRTATALLLDLSFSMPLRGHWAPAKRMALALHALIEGKYPQDSLYLIGFSDYARRLEAAALASTGWEEVQGTNMQHAFMLARRVLNDDPRPTKQVIMVTDGEPTAHLEDGRASFHWPPVQETIEQTLREAIRLSRSGIAINIFLLEETPGLARFMERLARLTGGTVAFAPSADIGGVVVSDYITRRQRRSA